MLESSPVHNMPFSEFLFFSSRVYMQSKRLSQARHDRATITCAIDVLFDTKISGRLDELANLLAAVVISTCFQKPRLAILKSESNRLCENDRPALIISFDSKIHINALTLTEIRALD